MSVFVYFMCSRSRLMVGGVIVFIVAVCVLFGFLGASLAGEIHIGSYYVSPSGKYDRLRLVPRSATGISCDAGMEGLLYFDETARQLEVCRSVAGVSRWSPLGSVWKQVDDGVDGVVYPKDLGSLDLSVALGSDVSEFRLTLDKGAAAPDGGILAIGTFGSGRDLVTSGAGTRLIWYPKKAAFRAGYVSGTQWDDGNIGNYSVAFGKNSIAAGIGTVAMAGARVTGSYSVGIAYKGVVSGSYSTAIGGSSTPLLSVSGDYVGAIGGNFDVSGDYAAVLGGWGAVVDGDYSVSLNGGITSGDYSVAVGTGSAGDTRAISFCSIAFGRYNVDTGASGVWTDTDPLFMIGNGDIGARHNAVTVLKNSNFCVSCVAPEFRLTLDQGETTPDGGILAIGSFGAGQNLVASGAGTRLIWYPRKAAFRAGYVSGTQWDDGNIGDYSVGFLGGKASGIGSFSVAGSSSGDNSCAIGLSAVAGGDYSLAVGKGSATGKYSVLLSWGGNSASGELSLSLGGYACSASGKESAVLGGIGVTAVSAYSVVLGRYNVSSSGDALNWIGTDPLFVIGIGSVLGGADNAWTVLKNGNVAIGHLVSPQSVLQVDGSLQVSTLSSAPPPADCAAGFEGRMRFDSSNNKLYVCDGVSWYHADLF